MSAGPFRPLKRGEQRREFEYTIRAGARRKQVVIIRGGQWPEVWSRHTRRDGVWTTWMGGRYREVGALLRELEARA